MICLQFHLLIIRFHNSNLLGFTVTIISEGEPGSVVDTATRYGLDGPGIESRWGEIFRTYPYRLRGPPSLLYNGYRVFPGDKGRRGVMLTTHPLQVPRLRKSWSVPPLTLWVLLGVLRSSFYLFLLLVRSQRVLLAEKRCVITLRSIKKVDGICVDSWVNAHISDSVAAAVWQCLTFRR